MSLPVSRSEKKRQAKQIEGLAKELVALAAGEVESLPCDSFLRQEIRAAQSLTGGARKRQVKRIAKELRHGDPGPLLAFLEQRKGSRLAETCAFHALELLREQIISEALTAQAEARDQEEPMPDHWPSPALEAAAQRFPELDQAMVRQAARRYVASRKPVHRREIFRQIRAAQERRQLRQRQQGDESG